MSHGKRQLWWSRPRREDNTEMGFRELKWKHEWLNWQSALFTGIVEWLNWPSTWWLTSLGEWTGQTHCPFAQLNDCWTTHNPLANLNDWSDQTHGHWHGCVNELPKHMIRWYTWMTEVTKHMFIVTAGWTNWSNPWFVFGLLSNRGYLNGIVLLCYRQTIVVCCVSL